MCYTCRVFLLYKQGLINETEYNNCIGDDFNDDNGVSFFFNSIDGSKGYRITTFINNKEQQMKEIKPYTTHEIEKLCNAHNLLVTHDYRVNDDGMVFLIEEAQVGQNLPNPYYLIPSNQTIGGNIVKFDLEWA